MIYIKPFGFICKGFYGACVFGGRHIYSELELRREIMHVAVAQHFGYLREVIVAFADIGFGFVYL